MLLGGISKTAKGQGLGHIYVKSYHSQMYASGIKHFQSHISACNLPILNLNIRNYHGKVIDAFIVMRKLYPENFRQNK